MNQNSQNVLHTFPNMKKLTWLLILTILTASCITRKACERRFPGTGKDSTSLVSSTQTIIRDTTIYVLLSGDTVFSSIPAKTGEISLLSTPLSSSTAWVTNGKLNHRLQQKDTLIASTIKGALKTTNSTSERKELKNQVTYTNRLTPWQWVQVYMGRALGVIMVVGVGWLLLRSLKLKV